jgi:beta-N-acetylhexosaminidase
MHEILPILLALLLLTACGTSPPPLPVEPPVPPAPPVQAPTPLIRAPQASLSPSLPAAGQEAGMLLPSIPEQAEPSAADRLVEERLQEMSLEQKIGQRILSGVPGIRPTERTRRLIREGRLGGVLLGRQNVAGRQQLQAFIAGLQEAARQGRPAVGLLVAVDQEGGRVSRLDLEGLTRFPPPHAWAGYQDPDYIEAVAYITAREVLELGCNLNLAPVLDLYAEGDATVIGDRSLGAEAESVAERGLAYLRGAHRAGIAAAVKHFPGHGRTTVDTHQRPAVLQIDAGTLWEQDLLPFRLAIEEGVEAVMTAHVLYPQLDPRYPATLSEILVRGMLRGRLGYQGVVISDDIAMGAITRRFPLREVLKRLILAGVDIILEFGGLDAIKLIEEIKALLHDGELTLEQIEEGTRRVLALKARYRLL